jgi:hypothetical protein
VRARIEVLRRSPARQAYEALHWAFVVAPVVSGLDKFTQRLAHWDDYLAPPIAKFVVSPRGFMMAVGMIEIMAGVAVAVKPKVGGYVVAAWLLAIVANLLLSGRAYDVALRDLGLAVAAFALARLATAAQRREI